jgi:hypothetical protein
MLPADSWRKVIWLNIVNFFGLITKVDGGGFEMLTNPNADPQSAYVKKELTVTVDADTLFDASAKEDLKLGRDVQMVGLDLKNGTIRATRLTVYEGNRPVRRGDRKVLPPTGPPKSGRHDEPIVIDCYRNDSPANSFRILALATLNTSSRLTYAILRAWNKNRRRLTSGPN